MLDILPHEIIDEIISNLTVNPIQLYNLRMINKLWFNKITHLSGKYKTHENETVYDEICKKNTSKDSFSWYLRNGVSFTLSQINFLIRYNRIDCFYRGLQNQPFLNTLFNRFYLATPNLSDIFSISEQHNPAVCCVKYNRVKLLDIMLNAGELGNPFLVNMNGLFDVANRYGHKEMVSYLVREFWDKFDKGWFQTKAHKTIYRIKNSEDFFFYCIQTDKLTVTMHLLSGMIHMSYYELFRFSLPKFRLFAADFLSLVKLSIEHEKISFLHLLFQQKEARVINKRIFTMYVTGKKLYSKSWVHHLNMNYLHYIDTGSNWLHMCLYHEMNLECIQQLVEKGYVYGKNEMKHCIEYGKMDILKYLVNHIE